MKKVAVLMGSESDLNCLQEGLKLLSDFKVAFHLEVVSAHRTPERLFEFSKTASAQGCQLILAAAGGSAHLPGMVAALTELPVIGIPVESKKLKGLDSLLSIVQMPKGVPVATVAIENSFNAALLAVQILALQDKKLHRKLRSFRKRQTASVKKMNQAVRAFSRAKKK
ncbi:MAG: 5-(carboxyamino)imidazole ribonucleotide mutase [Proteobacteria bacterium]|jgi:5-(carboxyamino)imidazole ribonucleotide mutase|nr:5-(carboxyamino)imidazole ribonucleotide mutase [Pseudomonadota bacterium]